MPDVKNAFWKECLNYWSELNKKQLDYISRKDDLISTKLWFNSKIQIGKKPIYYKHFEKGNIFYINDLLEEGGNFYTFVDFKKHFETIKTNFLEYESLIQAVKCFIRNSPLSGDDLVRHAGPLIPLGLSTFFTSQSACAEIYRVFVKDRNVPTAQKKFTEKGFTIENNLWKKYYILPHKCSLDTSLQWLQFRIVHRILATNSFLFKIHLVDSDLCTFCNTEKETLEHLFYDCYVTKHFLSDFCDWVLTKVNLHSGLFSI